MRGEVRVMTGDTQIASEREREAAPHRRAVDCRNDRLWHLVDREHEFGELLLQHLDEADRPAVARDLRDLVAAGHVGARAKPLALAREHDDAHRSIDAQRRECFGEIAHHARRQRVVLGGVIELDERDALARGRVDDDLHGCSPLWVIRRKR